MGQPSGQPVRQLVRMVVDNDDLPGEVIGGTVGQAGGEGALEQVDPVVAQDHDTGVQVSAHMPVPRMTTRAVRARIWMSSHRLQRRI